MTISKPSKLTLKEVFLQQNHRLNGLADGAHIPYATRLSFAPMLRFWQTKTQDDDAAVRLLALEILAQVKQAPEFWQPVEDLAMLEYHRETFELLMSGIFPACLRETQLGRATKPFDLQAFYITPQLEKLFFDSHLNCTVQQQKASVSDVATLRACLLILQEFYGQRHSLQPELTFTLEPENGGFAQHFKSQQVAQFFEVVKKKPLKKLSEKHIRQLLDNIFDLDAWLDALPPGHFEIHGVAAYELADLTTEESISRLRSLLLQKDALTNPQNIARLEASMKSYLRLSDLRLGILTNNCTDEKNDVARFNLSQGLLKNKVGNSAGNGTKGRLSVHDKACKYQEFVLVEDFKKLDFLTPTDEALKKAGFNSYLVAPLKGYDNRLIGLLELASPNAYDLNSFAEWQLREILPEFSRAVERILEEANNRIEAILRDKFTAIHPSVEWRFHQAAVRYLERWDSKGKAVMEPILFKDVYPIFGQVDIVSSSKTRNQAIQQDLVANLLLVKQVLEMAQERIDFPLVRRYRQRTEQQIERLEDAMQSSEEPLFIDFLLNEIHPLFKEIASKDPALSQAVEQYFQQLDPRLGLVYDKRKAYEESVSRINDALSDFLDAEEQRVQTMVPHYFEKYQTDGVQFELYAGQSLLENGSFSRLHLHNLRLWQLIAMCELTRLTRRLKQELPTPLETAQLIFVYGQPISIRFRLDEKSFDVDGAYNLRYEIIKKRIDKAFLLETEERLTQAGKIAIVYATDKDREEYMDYLDFLKTEGCIEDEIEEVELERLQETQGLRALRVTVK